MHKDEGRNAIQFAKSQGTILPHKPESQAKILRLRFRLVRPSIPEEIMRTVSVKLPDQLEANLSKLAKRRGLSKSALVQEALEAYLAGMNGQEQSCLNVAKDLWGSLQGPGDLSSNKKYLEGYGR
jgi:predicted DNA-binding protein